MAATATTNPATNITSTAATLEGTVNPDGVEGRSYFEYGPTTSYGHTTSLVDIGDGTDPVDVARRITSFSPGSVQHYRVLLNTDVIPPSDFGDDLPARVGSSSGTTFDVDTLDELETAIGAVTPDDIISVNSSINGGGAQLNVNCNGSSGAPITITSGGGDLHGFSQVYVTGTYIRFYQIDVYGCTFSNIKITGSTNWIEVDGCEIYDSARMGILVTANSSNVQIWNNVIHDNGSPSNGNLDHGIYFSYARGSNVIANNLCYHNCAYNIQIYPDSPNVILSCNTVDDGMVHAQARGGIVVGSNPGAPLTINTRNVGMIVTRAAQYGVALYNPGPGNVTYWAIGFDNGIANGQTGSGMTYTPTILDADPLFTDWDARIYTLEPGSPAIDYIAEALYGLVTPKYRTGEDRLTADCGSEKQV